MKPQRFVLEVSLAVTMLLAGGCVQFIQKENPSSSGNETILQLVQQKTIQDTIEIWKQDKPSGRRKLSCEELEIEYLKKCVDRKPNIGNKPEVIERVYDDEEEDMG